MDKQLVAQRVTHNWLRDCDLRNLRSGGGLGAPGLPRLVKKSHALEGMPWVSEAVWYHRIVSRRHP